MTDKEFTIAFARNLLKANDEAPMPERIADVRMRYAYLGAASAFIVLRDGVRAELLMHALRHFVIPYGLEGVRMIAAQVPAPSEGVTIILEDANGR